MIRRSKGKKTSKRRKSRLALRRECDTLFVRAGKDRDGWACVASGRQNGVQCAHICSRRYHATRWMLGNAVTLCAQHHMYYTHHPLEWDDWVTARLGEAGYTELRTLAKRGVDWIDYEAVLKGLEADRG